MGIVTKIGVVGSVVVLLGAGCNMPLSRQQQFEVKKNVLIDPVQKVKKEDPGQVVVENPAVMLNVDCKWDPTCSKNILADCSSGSFRTGTPDLPLAIISIVEKRSDGCLVDWRYDEKSFGLYSDKELLGISMSCLIDKTFDNPVMEIDKYITGDRSNTFGRCSGALKDKMFEPIKTP